MTELAISLSDIKAASPRVRAALHPSPLTHSSIVSALVGHDIYFKWENRFKTGSFKERGAINFLTALPAAARSKRVCAASMGNHALAVSHHASLLNIPCTIVMPVQAPLVKVQSTRKTGAQVLMHGNSFVEAYAYAQQLSAKEGYGFISAFDDPLIIAGQGTCGLEILEQLPDLDSVIVPIGGGGLMSGIAVAIKETRPDVFTLGVQSEWANKARRHSGNNQTHGLAPVTIADGIAVKGIGKFTEPILKKYVDSLAEVTEDEIAGAIVKFLELERAVVEGAGAAAFAALLKKALPSQCKKTAVIVSGSNIDMNVLSRIIARDMGQHKRLLQITVAVPDRPGSLHTVTGILAQLGANVLEVIHNRSFSSVPANVDISFLLEVRDQEHSSQILGGLAQAGLEVTQKSAF